MPKGQDWMNFIIINIGYLLLSMSVVYLSSIAEIRKNWNKYRCDPMYSPFSENISDDFNYCVKQNVGNLMPDFLAPITYVLQNLSTMGLGLTDDIQQVRAMFDYIRTQVTNIVNTIMSVFINLIIEFTKISLGLKDMMGKMIGVVSVLVNILDSSFKTMSSGHALIIKPIVCFHPDTTVKLHSGQILCMKDILPGSILENGAKVLATMNIDNSHGEPLYQIKNAGVNNEDIYVTGSHFILYQSKYILVKTHPDAIPQNKITSPNYACLITSDHTIQIGQHTFWDWEDDELTIIKSL